MTERFVRDTSEPFNLDVLPVNDPAVATEFTVKLGETYTYELLGLTCILATDANAANRNLVIRAHLGTDLLFACAAQGLQTASETLTYVFAVNLANLDLSATSGLMTVQLPSPFPLPDSTSISSLIDSIQVGDQLSTIRLYLKRWPVLEG